MNTTEDFPHIRCVYCDKNHASWKCFTVTDTAGRKAILRKKGRCYLCLKASHISRFCAAKYKCAKCKGRHNVSICEKKPGEAQDSNNDVKVLTTTLGNRKSTTFLQSAKAVIFDQSRKHQKSVRILFDNCSRKSFGTQKVAKELNLPSVRAERIIVNGFGGKQEKLVVLDIVRVLVYNTEGTKCGEVELYVVPYICKPICDQEIELAQATYEHLISLKLADSSDGETKMRIDVLIGADFYWDFVTKVVIRSDDGPVAVKTSLGWVLSGKMIGREVMTSTNLISAHVMKTTVESEEDGRLEDLVHKFWSLDAINISDKNETGVFERFTETTFFENGRYTVCLPWKDAVGVIPDNFQLCQARLNSLMRRLRKNPKLLQEYNEIIRRQQAEGIVEDVNDEICEAGSVHYLPHREVVREEKDTTKIRIVYDGSAKVKNGISLNDCLEAGPCMLPHIFDILIRFRCYKYVIISDIKSAFLNVRVNENDRNFMRFLWVDDIHSSSPKLVVK